MSGVEILAIEKVATNSGFNIDASFIAFVIAFILSQCIIASIMFPYIDIDDVCVSVLIGFWVGICCALLFGVACAEPTEYRDEYKVIVSDEVSMNDFFEKYEVIDCEGSIYTVIEK